MARRIAGLLMVGAFPGFVWGWFQVEDYRGGAGWANLPTAYGLPLLGAAVTLILLLVARRVVVNRQLLYRGFAAAAIACYYWYRLPALVGFGPFPGDGMLVDLTATLPAWLPAVSRIATTALFFWLLVGRPTQRSWSRRPAVALP